MDRRSSLRLAGSILAGLLVVGAAPVAAGAPQTRYVGPGGGTGPCAAPALTSIQAAIDASTQRDTIIVCAGVYEEQLAISESWHDGLTIRAAVPWKAVVRSTGGVYGIGILGPDRVRISGLKLRMAPSACSTTLAGIWVTEESQDAVIRGNRIVSGRADSIGACDLHTGIKVDAWASAWIGYNQVTDFAAYGIQVLGFATIEGNSIRYRHAAETSTDDRGIGIDVTTNGVATVVRNAVTGLASGGISTPRLERGIQLSTLAGDSVVRGNLVRYATWGSEVFLAPSFIFRGNTLLDSWEHGLRIVSSSGVVRGNTSLGSGLLDCYEDASSVTWIGNTGETDSPDGLCEPPTR